MNDKQPERKKVDEQPQQKIDELSNAELDAVTGGSLSLNFTKIAWTYTSKDP